jgi:serine/threonine-protein phosphatase 2B catalytic subunit
MQEPLFVIGDIHGQFFDLVHMFEKAIDGVHDLNKTSLLFLGDYVDRGKYGVGCVLFLFSLKLNFPKTVTLLRGNHESIAMTEMFTFREEVLEKYNGDEGVYDSFMDAFETLQLAAEVNKDYLCVHGGISPHLKTIADINAIDRFVEPPLEGLLCDLLWSDPAKDAVSKSTGFVENGPRECAWYFGLTPLKALLKHNNYLAVMRAHEV